MVDIWKHYKGGIYNVITLAYHTETGEELVVYEDSKGKVWVRPSKMFLEKVEVNGVMVDRFKQVGSFFKQI